MSMCIEGVKGLMLLQHCLCNSVIWGHLVNLSLPPLTQAMLKLAISVLKADFKYYLSWEWGGGGATSGISYEQVAD